MAQEIVELRTKLRHYESHPQRISELEQKMSRFESEMKTMSRDIREARDVGQKMLETVYRLDRDLTNSHNTLKETMTENFNTVSQKVARLFWTGAGVALILGMLLTVVQIYLQFKGLG